jgi:hypothetical protein
MVIVQQVASQRLEFLFSYAECAVMHARCFGAKPTQHDALVMEDARPGEGARAQIYEGRWEVLTWERKRVGEIKRAVTLVMF